VVKKAAAARKSRRQLATVHALPGADRPEDSLKRLHEVLANEAPSAVIIISVDAGGKIDVSSFGKHDDEQLMVAAARIMLVVAQGQAGE
jgi:hypothetical protein